MDINCQQQPIILEINKHTHTTIPPPPNPPLPHDEWITIIAKITKDVKYEARKITTTYLLKQNKKTISKHQRICDKNPKKKPIKLSKSTKIHHLTVYWIESTIFSQIHKILHIKLYTTIRQQ